MSGRVQIFVQQNAIGAEIYDAFKTYDVGDIIGVRGTVFKTKTGELSVKAQQIELLVKGIRPLPEKWAGLTDTEIRYRQRYVDLIVNPEVKRAFEKRGQSVRFIRNFLDALGFIEVETPMRSEEHTSELQSLMRTSYAVFCLKKKARYTPANVEPTTATA